MTTLTTATIAAPLGFVRPENVLAPRDGRPGHRARTVSEPVRPQDLAAHVCDIEDLDATGGATALTTHGFESMRVPDRRGLHRQLRTVRDGGRMGDEDIRAIRRGLTGARLRSSDGSTLLIVHVAGEGVILRNAGPNNLPLGVPGEAENPDGAAVIHADQDPLGRPFHQITKGMGRRIFRHESIDTHNRRSPLLLVNLWMPLQQATRPLTLMDTRTLDRARDQLHYELPTQGILDREDEDDINDIWWFRHDPAQRWFFRSATGLGDAWVFDTLSTPHGAFNVPGEEVAAEGHRLVGDAIVAVEAGQPVAASAPLDVEAAATPALRGAIAELQTVLDEAPARGDRQATAWLGRARRARDAVIRKSIEVRAVAVRLPGRRAR
ncbi:MAG: hypothetical protein R3249_10155 [Nitriliruptorales bacterium]|nr:hypothetical protein [Nitriliruptorales bacterium]